MLTAHPPPWANWTSVVYTFTLGQWFFFPVWKCQSLSHVQLFATPWTVAHQAPLSTKFSRQEYWSGLHFPSPGKNTGAGCHSLLQGIFPTQGSNPGLPHCRQILYHMSHMRTTWRPPDQLKQNPWSSVRTFVFLKASGWIQHAPIFWYLMQRMHC